MRRTEPFIVWVKQNEEADLMRSLIPDAVEVRGNETPEQKEKKLLGFAAGEFRVLLTKTKIAQFGLNYQHCHNQVFASLDFQLRGSLSSHPAFVSFRAKAPGQYLSHHDRHDAKRHRLDPHKRIAVSGNAKTNDRGEP
jgi:hypothetical protein